MPSTNGNKIIIGSTLVSIVVIGRNLWVNLIFQGLQDSKEISKKFNLESRKENKKSEKQAVLRNLKTITKQNFTIKKLNKSDLIT